MGFSDSGRPEQYHVGSFVNEAQGAQLADLALVDGGLEGEIELLESLDVGQVGQLQPRFQVALPPDIGFGVHHFEQEIGIGGFSLRCRLQQAFQARVDGRQVESGERGAQLFDGSHRAAPHAIAS
jgi:hypothetical protein